MVKSLRHRLLLLIALITVPGYAAIILSMVYGKTIALENLKQHAISVTESVAAHQADIIDKTERYLKNLSSLPAVKQPDQPQCGQFLADILKFNTQYVNLGIPMPNGDLLCNALPMTHAVNVFDRGYFQQSLTDRSFGIGNFQHDRAANTTSINFSYPVIDPQSQQIKGIAVAVVSLQWWSDHLLDSQLPAESIALISDQSGIIIASYPENTTLIGQPITAFSKVPAISQDNSNKAILQRSSDGIRRVFHHETMIRRDDTNYFTLSVGIAVEDALRQNGGYFYWSLAAYTALMLLITIIARLFLRRSILNPIEHLIDATQQLQKGQLSSNYQCNGALEMDRLHQHFEQMAQTRLEVERQIRHQAYTDALTGLANRSLFLLKGQEAIIQADKGDKHAVALLYIDLDNFKEINDMFGHHAGDQLLIAVARRLLNIPENILACRQGGDEFTVIISDLTQLPSVLLFCEKLLKILAQPIYLEDHRLFITASIGFAIFPQDGLTFDTLMASADQAMFAAKKAGKNQVKRFTPDMQVAFLQKFELSSDMRDALKSEQFRVYYQPIVNLKGQVKKAEVLIRWLHPGKGFISPAEFIPIAEETGWIIAIGDWVFQQACAALELLKHHFGPDFQVSINVSPIQFTTDRLPLEDWQQRLAARQLEGSDLIIEITEGVMMSACEDTQQCLLACRDKGIQLALDDFGTGYSSLAYIRQFDIDYLKIDRSFVENLGKDDNTRTLCEAMVSIAHKLDIEVVAEGVETAEQARMLKAMGCDYQQGFLIAKPLPLDELIARWGKVKQH